MSFMQGTEQVVGSKQSQGGSRKKKTKLRGRGSLRELGIRFSDHRRRKSLLRRYWPCGGRSIKGMKKAQTVGKTRDAFSMSGSEKMILKRQVRLGS